jgi:hypothetical protein
VFAGAKNFSPLQKRVDVCWMRTPFMPIIVGDNTHTVYSLLHNAVICEKQALYFKTQKGNL